MNNLLLFFALPVATIILAVVLQRIIKSPILVALTAFAIYLIVAFSAFDETFLVFAIVYTILAFIAAVLYNFIKKLIRCNNNNNNDSNDDTDDNDDEDDCGCGCGDNGNGCNCGTRDINRYGSYRMYNRRY